MLYKLCILFYFSILACSESAFIDTLEEIGRCSVKDNPCQEKLYTSAVQIIAPTGIPENGIPPFDPFVIKNMSVSVANLIDITMVDGVAKNLKGCVLNRINTTIESYHSTMEVTCDVTIKGKYKVSSSSPLVQNLLGGLGNGGAIRGDGLAKLKIEKLHITFDFDLFLRESNGEVFIDCTYKDTHYKYDIGNMHFAANNLYIGDQELSAPMIALLNNNWRFIMTAFGKPFMDFATDIVFEYTHKFFDVTPARYYLLEDLREYLPNSPKKN